MTEATAQRPAPGAAVREAVRETGSSLSAVFRNPGMRRIQLALAGSMIGDWAVATAMAVWIYGVGGAAALGIWSAIRLTLMAFTSPLTATLADRFPRKRVMIAADVARALLVAVNGVLILVGAPVAPVFVLSLLMGLFGTPFRAAQRSLMPALATRPEELTASNGTSSTIESVSFFVGPALGAFLLGVTDIATVLFFDAVTFGWSMLMVAGIRVPRRDDPDPAGATAPEPEEAAAQGGGEGEAAAEPTSGFIAETVAGFRTVAHNRDLLVTIGVASAQTVVAGASAVFEVVIAIEILRSGAKGVGYLDSILGVGAIIGGFWAISRGHRRKHGTDLILGTILWSLPLVLLSLSPTMVVAFVVMALLGLANPLVDVNMDTIMQRVTPDEVMGRVFGVMETCIIATMAVGALVMPLLIHLLGLRGALATVGVAVALLACLGVPQMRSLDRRLAVPAGVPLLNAVPMFAPLGALTIETLARALVRVEVPAGQVVLSEGGESDRFFVIESGRVEVTQHGAVLRQEGPGDFFGEIGLLRDVPRTATITALEDTVLQALEREDFLDAVTGKNEARTVAEDIASRRLAARA